ncbi:hypothetical protein GPROT1_04020 [Gammaproteobacteria bacterium]|nr:hypothetical protein GPROT1_04020 [Gammaproteobacteria bacterium]
MHRFALVRTKETIYFENFFDLWMNSIPVRFLSKTYLV